MMIKPWMRWSVAFEPRDVWVGLYWKRHECALDLYFCLLPMCPINFYIQW